MNQDRILYERWYKRIGNSLDLPKIKKGEVVKLIVSGSLNTTGRCYAIRVDGSDTAGWYDIANNFKAIFNPSQKRFISDVLLELNYLV